MQPVTVISTATSRPAGRMFFPTAPPIKTPTPAVDQTMVAGLVLSVRRLTVADPGRQSVEATGPYLLLPPR